MKAIFFSPNSRKQVLIGLQLRFGRFLCLLIGFYSLATVESSGQQLIDYFKYQGVKTLADFAHPSNTFQRGTFDVYPGYFGLNDDMIIVKIYYRDNYSTQIAIRKQYGLFTKIAVVEDHDFVQAFTAVTLLKELMIQYMKSTDASSKNMVESRLEKFLQRQLSYTNGLDIALYTINLEWLKY